MYDFLLHYIYLTALISSYFTNEDFCIKNIHKMMFCYKLNYLTEYSWNNSSINQLQIDRKLIGNYFDKTFHSSIFTNVKIRCVSF